MINKHKNLLIKIIFCIIVSILLLRHIDFNAYYAGHDGLFHINRLEGIVKAFEDHQFLTYVYPYTNNGYGYGLSLFYCDFFLYPFALIYKIGVPLITSYVLMICFYSCLSIFSIMWVSSRIFEKNKFAPYIATVLYTFCNYHLADLFVRNALGEILSITFIPFVFYSLYKIFIKKEDAWISLGLSYGALALCHNITLLIYGIFFVILFVVYIIIERNRQIIKNALFTSLKGIILAILISLFYLLPLLEQTTSLEFLCTKYYFRDYNLATSTQSIQSILRSNFVRGSYQFIPNCGTVLACCPILYFFTKKKNKYIISLIVLYVFCLLYLLGFLPILYNIKILNALQYSWRIYIFIFPLLVFILTYILVNLDKRITYVVIGLYMITTIFSDYWLFKFLDNSKWADCSRLPYDTVHESIYDPSILSSNFYYNFTELMAGEYLPPTESYDYLKETTYIKKIIGDDFDEVKVTINGVKEYLIYDRKGTLFDFEYESDGNETLMIPLIYYKGYSAYYYDGNDKIKIPLVWLNKYKQVAFNTVKGNHRYIVHYDGTIIQKVSLVVSLASLLFVLYLKHIKLKYNKISL